MTFNTQKSKEIFTELAMYEAGGVGSSERLRISPHPLSIAYGKGSKIFDVDGNEFIDYVLGFGPLILGHCPEPVVQAVKSQIDLGTQFATPTELELTVSKKLVDLVPCFELMRFNQSGSEAVQGAIRVARGFTGRNKIIKFEGHYHGWMDNINVSYATQSFELMGPRENPNRVVTQAGQSPSVLNDLIILPWNDIDAVERAIAREGDKIAAIISEPIMCNAGVILPKPGFLQDLRKITTDNNILLIFDEVITGFRVDLHGAQGYFGVTPDLATFAKAMAGGLPGSCFGGRADVMRVIADGKVGHAGTYNSNSLVLAAINATLDELSKDNGAAYTHMAKLSTKLRHGLEEIFSRAGIPCYFQGPETVFSMAFTEKPIHEYRDLLAADAEKLMRFRHELRIRGIYTKPTPRDVWYVSTAHTDSDIEKTLEVAEEAIKIM